MFRARDRPDFGITVGCMHSSPGVILRSRTDGHTGAMIQRTGRRVDARTPAASLVRTDCCGRTESGSVVWPSVVLNDASVRHDGERREEW